MARTSILALLACAVGCSGPASEEEARRPPPQTTSSTGSQEGLKPLKFEEVRGNAEARTIPLKEIYSTNGQKGLKPVQRHLAEPYGHDLNELYLKFHGGASNILLVRGKDFAEAVRSTRWGFAGVSADAPVEGPYVSKAAPLWVVAYLGAAGSEPPVWLVHSVVVQGPTVRVTFRKQESLGNSADFHHYFVWIPLGQAIARTYTLELFDADKQEVVLSRRVTAAED
jgi:hypothetical protein